MRFLLALFLLLPLVSHGAEGDILEPEQAFKLSAKVLDAGHIEARYQIADGYYLYREKFKFSAQPADVTLGTPQFPAGAIKQDEFFGKVETYRNQVAIQIPYTRTGSSAETITLVAVSQGCADAGVCYPPITQKIELQLPAAPAAVPAAAAGPVSSGLSALKQLGADLGGGGDSEFLPPDQAFQLAVTAAGPDTLVADFTPAASYYLYRDKIAFTVKSPAGVTVSKVELPKGDIKTDPTFGKTEVYHKPFRALLTLGGNIAPGTKLTLAATYQGCSEKGVCYPPINKNFDLTLPATAVTVPPVTPSAQTAGPGALEPSASTANSSEPSQVEALLQGGNLWVILAAFFGFGLLLSLTPCVFPMIPILAGIIAGQKEMNKVRGFTLAMTYVQGMAITYALAGVAAGLTGTLLSAALQNPWVLGTFALVFVALALSMFGFYELQLPNFIQSKFSDASNRMKSGTIAGVFVMGILSAVIVGPCVAAPLAGALLYIGQTHNVVLGGSALYAMALGMGVPLLLVGMSAGALLPKAGAWMNMVKSFFGVLLLAVAIWLINPVIPAVASMLLWAALLIVSAIYLKAVDPLPPNAHGGQRFWKGVGVIALVSGVALLIGALSGSRDILQPLGGLRAQTTQAGAATPAAELHFEPVKSVADLEQRIQQAKGQYVMLDFYADWCVSCKELDRFTFGDPQVQAKLKNVVLLRADVTANNDNDRALLKKFRLFGPPGIIFFDKDGQEIRSARTIGYTPPKSFLEILDRVGL